MNILLDIGNSSAQWVWEKEGNFYPGESCLRSAGGSRQRKKTCASIQKKITEVPENILVSCVTTEHREWTDALQGCWHMPIQFAHTQREMKGLLLAYKDISQFGVDRWLNILAAWHEQHRAFCVVSCGTACTIDIVDGNGRHVGGYIIPGLAMMAATLRKNTARIRNLASSTMQLSPGQDTTSCVANGALLAVSTSICAAVQQADQWLDTELACLITGGDANRVAQQLTIPLCIDEMLLFRGLLYAQEK